MSNAGHAPFDADIAEHGRYQYTGGDRLSSTRANRRYSQMILSAVDYRGKLVIDVGCGDGTYTRELLNTALPASLLGIDPSAPAIEVARASAKNDPRLTFRCAAAGDLVSEGAAFDIAVYRGVLHHTADPAREIANALRLAPTVVILEPNGANPVLKILERTSSYHLQHGERSFRSGTLARWIANGEGQVRSATFFGLVPHFSPDWFVKISSAMEPLIERVPVVRRFVCGQILMVAQRT